MALRILYPGIEPIGRFDVEDGYLLTILGGEIGTLRGEPRTIAADHDRAVADAWDGYTNVTDQQRAVITPNIAVNTARPLWLLDEGLANYGTLFGQVIGGVGGQAVTGTNLGPHTAYASGKVTCWDKPGLYAVTLDAGDTHLTQGLMPTNANCDPQRVLYPTILGKITPTVGRSVGGAGPVIGRFVEFETTARSLVRTPATLVGAAEVFEHAVIAYRVE